MAGLTEDELVIAHDRAKPLTHVALTGRDNMRLVVNPAPGDPVGEAFNVWSAYQEVKAKLDEIEARTEQAAAV